MMQCLMGKNVVNIWFDSCKAKHLRLNAQWVADKTIDPHTHQQSAVLWSTVVSHCQSNIFNLCCSVKSHSVFHKSIIPMYMMHMMNNVTLFWCSTWEPKCSLNFLPLPVAIWEHLLFFDFMKYSLLCSHHQYGTNKQALTRGIVFTTSHLGTLFSCSSS